MFPKMFQENRPLHTYKERFGVLETYFKDYFINGLFKKELLNK